MTVSFSYLSIHSGLSVISMLMDADALMHNPLH